VTVIFFSDKSSTWKSWIIPTDISVEALKQTYMSLSLFPRQEIKVKPEKKWGGSRAEALDLS